MELVDYWESSEMNDKTFPSADINAMKLMPLDLNTLTIFPLPESTIIMVIPNRVYLIGSGFIYQSVKYCNGFPYVLFLDKYVIFKKGRDGVHTNP